MEDLYDGGAGVYSEAKGEYTKQLIQYLTPALGRFFMKLFAQAQQEVASVQGGRGLLAKFQELMSVVPEWNIDKVQRETATVIGETKCDYLEELLSAVFIAHTKVLTAIRPNSWKNKKVQIVVPKMDHFVHRAMSECCRLLWKTTYLFQQDLPAVEKQKNYRGIEFQIGEGVSNAIRGLLPVKNILKDCLADADGDDVGSGTSANAGTSATKSHDDDSDSDSDDEEEVKKQEPTPTPTPTPQITNPIVPQEETVKEFAKPADEVKVEKLDEVASINSKEGTVEVQGGSTEDMSDNDRVFTHKAVQEISVEKMDSEPVVKTEESIIVDTSNIVEPAASAEVAGVDTGPSVKFNDYDQVYTPIVGGGGNTTLAYAPKDGEEDDDGEGDYAIDILGDAGSVLSELEELDFNIH